MPQLYQHACIDSCISGQPHPESQQLQLMKPYLCAYTVQAAVTGKAIHRLHIFYFSFLHWLTVCVLPRCFSNMCTVCGFKCFKCYMGCLAMTHPTCSAVLWRPHSHCSHKKQNKVWQINRRKQSRTVLWRKRFLFRFFVQELKESPCTEKVKRCRPCDFCI